MNPNIFTQRIIKLALVGFCVVLLEGAAIWYLSAKIAARAAEISQKRSLVSSLQNDQLEFSTLKGDYEKVEPYLAQIQSALPRAEELFGVVSEIERIAQFTGNKQTLAVEGRAPQPVPGVAGASFVTFSAELVGTYGSFRNYLQELNKASYFISIDSADIAAPDTIINESRIRITGRIFLK